MPSAHTHTCITWYDQSTCWGDGYYGQLGLGNTTDYLYPPSVAISLNADFVPIQTIGGYGHSCALSEDERVACWGYIMSVHAMEMIFRVFVL